MTLPAVTVQTPAIEWANKTNFCNSCSPMVTGKLVSMVNCRKSINTVHAAII